MQRTTSTSQKPTHGPWADHVAHSPRPAARASRAAARRHLPRFPRSKSLRAARCCAEASRAAITVSEGRRNEPGQPFGPRAALVLHSPRRGRLSSPGHARCHRPRPAGATAAELPAAARCCSLLRRMTSSSISNWAPAPRRSRALAGGHLAGGHLAGGHLAAGASNTKARSADMSRSSTGNAPCTCWSTSSTTPPLQGGWSGAQGSPSAMSSSSCKTNKSSASLASASAAASSALCSRTRASNSAWLRRSSSSSCRRARYASRKGSPGAAASAQAMAAARLGVAREGLEASGLALELLHVRRRLRSGLLLEGLRAAELVQRRVRP